MKTFNEVMQEIEAEFADLPNVGFVLVSHEVMERPAFADFMVDTFTFLEDRTTIWDREAKRSRLVLYSERFTAGWGQYYIEVEHHPVGRYTITKLELINKD